MGLLRLLLAVCVCAYHTAEPGTFSSLSGGAAVYLFFVISGFYMQMVLRARYTPALLGPSWKRSFYLARYARLLPAYVVALMASVGLALLMPEQLTLQHKALSHLLSMLFSSDWSARMEGVGLAFVQLSMLGLNMPSTGDLLVAPSWTLGVELAFYALAPFVLRMTNRHLACLMALGLGLRLMPYNTHLPLLAGIEMFCLGAWVQRRGHAWRWPDRIMRKLGLSGVSLLLMLAVMFTLPSYELVSIPKTHNELDVLVYPLAFAAFIPALFRVTMHSTIDRHIGELSYPFYIFHALVIDLLRGQKWWSGLATDGGLALASVACTLLVAVLFHQLERRFIEPYRQRLSKPLNKTVQPVQVDSAAEIRRAA